MKLKFVGIAYGTLVIDAYLVLATIASKVGVLGLPPFGREHTSDTGRFLAMLVATWTAALAIGWLLAHGRTTGQRPLPGTIWFLFVLVIGWLGVLSPVLVSIWKRVWELVI